MLPARAVLYGVAMRRMATMAAASSGSTSATTTGGKSSAVGKYEGWISPNGVIRLPEGRIWNHWKEVPMELVDMLNAANRDPTNPIYRHPRYINLRKKQIFFQQQDGLEIWRKGGTKDIVLFRIMQVCYATMVAIVFYNIYQELRLKKPNK